MAVSATKKLVLLHKNILNDTTLIQSFKDDCILIKMNDDLTIQNIIDIISNQNISHLTFVYHYLGWLNLPFFDNNIDYENTQTYKYFNNNIIDLIKKINKSNLIVDILTCSLNNNNFKTDVNTIQYDLGINIRYSLDQTGNNSQGNWILESDNINIKDLYFTNKIEQWQGVLTNARTPSELATNLPSYFSWNGTTLILLQDIDWNILTSIDGWATTDFIQLGENEIFDGQGFTINLNGIITDGLFATEGTSIENGSVIRYIGILNGNLNDRAGYIIRQNQPYFKVFNSYSSGSIDGQYGGGIAGQNAGNQGYCLIDSCYTSGIINHYQCGGIIGSNAGYNSGNCLIQYCYSTGNIQASYCGGITSAYSGYNSGNCLIQYCYSTGNIEASNSGGIIGYRGGYNSGNININKCYTTGSINASLSGGIAGYGAGSINGNVNIQNSYSNLKTGNLQGGTDNGSSAMDGNFPINDLLTYTDFTTISLGSSFMEAINPSTQYPLLKTFKLLPFDSFQYTIYNSNPQFLSKQTTVNTYYNDKPYGIILDISNDFIVSSNLYDYVDLSGSNWCIEFVFKPINYNNDFYLLNKFSDTTNYTTEYAIIYNGTQKRIELYNSTSIIATINVPTTNKYYHYAFNHNNGTLTNYLDNNSISASFVNSFTQTNAYGYIILGTQNATNPNTNNGSLDLYYLRIWKQSRTLQELQTYRYTDIALENQTPQLIINTGFDNRSRINNLYYNNSINLLNTYFALYNHTVDKSIPNAYDKSISINSYDNTTQTITLDYDIINENLQQLAFYIQDINTYNFINSIDKNNITIDVSYPENSNSYDLSFNYYIYDGFNVSETKTISINLQKPTMNFTTDTINYLNNISFNEDSSTNIIIQKQDINSVDLSNNIIPFTDISFIISGFDNQTLFTINNQQYLNDSFYINIIGNPNKFGSFSGSITIKQLNTSLQYSTSLNINVLSVNDTPYWNTPINIINWNNSSNYVDISFDEDTSYNIEIYNNSIIDIDHTFQQLNFSILDSNNILITNNDFFEFSILQHNDTSAIINIKGKQHKHISNLQGFIAVNDPSNTDLFDTIPLNLTINSVNDPINFFDTNHIALLINEDSSTTYTVNKTDINSGDILNGSITFNQLDFSFNNFDNNLISVSGNFDGDSYVFTFTGKPNKYGNTNGNLVITHPYDNTIQATKNFALFINSQNDPINFVSYSQSSNENNNILTIDISFNEDEYTTYTINKTDISSVDLTDGSITFNQLSFTITGLNNDLLTYSGAFDGDSYVFTFTGQTNKNGSTSGIINVTHPYETTYIANKQINILINKLPDPIHFINSTSLDISFNEDSSTTYTIYKTDISSIDLTDNSIAFTDLLFTITDLDSNLLTYSGVFVDDSYIFTFTGKSNKHGYTSGTIKITHPNEPTYIANKTINIVINKVVDPIDFIDNAMLDISFNEDENTTLTINKNDISSVDLTDGSINFNQLLFSITGLNNNLLSYSGDFVGDSYVFTFTGKSNKHGLMDNINIIVKHPLDNNIQAIKYVKLRIKSVIDTIDMTNIDKLENFTFSNKQSHEIIINKEDIINGDLYNDDISFTDISFVVIDNSYNDIINIQTNFVNNNFIIKLLSIENNEMPIDLKLKIIHPQDPTKFAIKNIKGQIIKYFLYTQAELNKIKFKHTTATTTFNGSIARIINTSSKRIKLNKTINNSLDIKRIKTSNTYTGSNSRLLRIKMNGSA